VPFCSKSSRMPYNLAAPLRVAVDAVNILLRRVAEADKQNFFDRLAVFLPPPQIDMDKVPRNSIKYHVNDVEYEQHVSREMLLLDKIQPEHDKKDADCIGPDDVEHLHTPALYGRYVVQVAEIIDQQKERYNQEKHLNIVAQRQYAHVSAEHIRIKPELPCDKICNDD
jgi:hypothetical protein